MLLTIKQPTHQGYKSFRDYTPPTPPSTSRFSPATTSGPSLPPLPLPTPKTTTLPMSTHHRGLPPLASTQQSSLQPIQQSSSIGTVPLNQPLGQLPAPPSQWQGAEESMRNWLHAKAEEDKRRQEEEKTRQETLRLEQRKIEQDMLKTSLSGGIPPHMIPMVFAGMGGGNLPNASLEWTQHYIAQAQQLQQQQVSQQPLLPSTQSQQSPEQIQHRDSRVIAPPYGQQHPAPLTLPSTPVGPSSQQSGPGFLPGYQMSPASTSRQVTQSALARQPQSSQLPRLNTGEILIQPPPPGGTSLQIGPGPSTHPLQQSQTTQPQESQSQSPTLYFHHWQPPTGTSQAPPPATPSDQNDSPKKRKATGAHQPAPPPTSQPQYTSPPFSSHTGSSVSNTPQSRRRGHSRQRSDLSARESYGRPPSRHRHTDSSYTSQSLESPREAPPQGLGRPSGGSHPVSSLLEQSDTRPLPQSAPQAPRRSPQYSAGPDMRHEERRMSSDGEDSRRAKMAKRDDGSGRN